MLESEVLEVHGSPSWSIEAHKQPTHSGESPLLANKFLSPSKVSFRHAGGGGGGRGAGGWGDGELEKKGIELVRGVWCGT